MSSLVSTESVALEGIASVTPALQGTSTRTSGGNQPVLAITPGALEDDQTVDWSQLKSVRPQGDTERYAVKHGDLLVVLRIPVKLALVDGKGLELARQASLDNLLCERHDASPTPSRRSEPNWPDSTLPVIAVGAMAIVRPWEKKADLVDPTYLGWHLSRRRTFHGMGKTTHGGALEFIHMNTLRQLRIPLPDIATQRKIGDLLRARRRIERLQAEWATAMDKFVDALIQDRVDPSS